MRICMDLVAGQLVI